MFDRWDENKDGFIDETEFARSRQRMGGGAQLGERLNRFLDADKDGSYEHLFNEDLIELGLARTAGFTHS